MGNGQNLSQKHGLGQGVGFLLVALWKVLNMVRVFSKGENKTEISQNIPSPGLIIAYIGWIWEFWDFPLGSRFYPRIRPHNPAIQIDTIHATLFPQGPPGRWYCEESKNWQNVARQGYRAILGTRWKIRTDWDRELAGNRGAHPVGLFLGSKTRKSGPKIKNMLDLPGFRAEIITY